MTGVMYFYVFVPTTPAIQTFSVPLIQSRELGLTHGSVFWVHLLMFLDAFAIQN